MHRDNNICFKCRTTFKNTFICPTCGQKSVSTCHTVRVPKKRKKKDWKKFIVWLKKRGPYYKEKLENVGY